MGGTLEIVDDGSSPPGPAPDKRKQFAFVGFVGGACLPIGFLLLIGLMDGKMRYSEEAGADMSGMSLLGFDASLQNIVTGLVLVLAVYIDQLYQRRRKI